MDYIVTLRVHDGDPDAADLPSESDMRQLLSRGLHEDGFDVEHVGVDRQ